MSVFADILVLAALIAAAWLGAKRGLLKSLAGLLIVVVALLGDEATVKRLKRQGREVRLLPENPAYQPIDGREARILGKVAAVIRRY